MSVNRSTYYIKDHFSDKNIMKQNERSWVLHLKKEATATKSPKELWQILQDAQYNLTVAPNIDYV